MAGRRHPTQEERDERVNLSDDPEEVLLAMLGANITTVEPDEDADPAR